jgi:hypothetical protein
VNLTLSIASAPSPWWQNWQVWTAIATAIIAVAAFTVGNLIKHWFDIRIEQKKDQNKARNVALALRAEALGLARQMYLRRESYRTAFILQARSEREGSLLIKGSAERLSQEIFKAHLDQLGLLPAELTADIIAVYSAVNEMYNGLEIYRTIIPSKSNISFFEKALFDHYKQAVELILPLIVRLSDFAKVPHPEIKVETMDDLLNRELRSLDKISSFLEKEPHS